MRGREATPGARHCEGYVSEQSGYFFSALIEQKGEVRLGLISSRWSGKVRLNQQGTTNDNSAIRKICREI